MPDVMIFGMSLHDFMKLVLIIVPIWGVLWAGFVMWGERNWKGLSDKLDSVAGPAGEPGEDSRWAIFKHSFKSAWRRDLWLPLAVIRALRKRRKG